MLTKSQKQVLSFIKSYTTKKGYAPSLEEIKKHLKISSVSTAHFHIKNLQKAGYLKKVENLPRAIELNNNKKLLEIPLVGTITAGQPIEAIENFRETITISDDIKNPEKLYALRVLGNSMIEEGIFDGDVVIIKKQSVAENGQTVVAIIDDNEATLKKIYREKGGFRLQPANQNVLPFYRKEVEIRGVVAQIVRNLENSSVLSPAVKPIKNLRTIDLFAGIGGIRIGFERAGFKTVFANDFEKNCQATYDLNFKDSKLVVEDIKKIGIDDLPEFDFLLGGFPCQSFSIAGYRQGFKDEKGRGDLFFDVAKIIEKRKPAGFLLENVKNLKSHDNGRTYRIIEETLQKIGYHVKSKILNSMDFGNVPQNRERFYIVGFKDIGHYENFNFPEPVKLTIKITDLLEKDVPEKYYYNGRPLYKKLKDQIKEEGRVYQWRRQYVRENKKGVCPTLTANMGMGGHNVPIIKDKKGIRKLMPLECARIQGFPNDFKLPSGLADSKLYKQFGNSVTVSVVERIAKEIMKAIKGIKPSL